MANINNYIEIVKYVPKGINSFISPTINQDIENIQKVFNAIKYNKILLRHNMRIIRLKKHKFMKKFKNLK